MKIRKIRQSITRLQDEIDLALIRSADSLSPIARFLIIFIIGGAMMVFSIWFVLSSMYNLGKQDAEIELLRQQEIDNHQPEQENSNIFNFENYKYE